MYSVYSVVDGEEICIYDDLSDAESLRLIDPQLELERNSAGKFTFTLPPTNLAYGTYIQRTYVVTGYRPVDSSNSQQDSNNQNEDTGQPDVPIEPIVEEKQREVDLMERMVSKIVIYRDEYTQTYGDRDRTKLKFWEGRVISESKDWFNCRAVECEGALAYLNDTVQNPKMFGTAASGVYTSDDPNDILNYILTVHNQKVDASKKFVFDAAGTIQDHRTGENLEPFEIGYVSSMEALKSLIDTYGGILQLYYYKDPNNPAATWETRLRWDDKDNVTHVYGGNPQTIDFGKNLLDFKCKWDLSKLCTVAIPTGAKIENTGTDEIGDPFPIRQGTPTKGQYLWVGDGDAGEKGIIYVVSSRSTTGYDLKSYKTAVFDMRTWDSEHNRWVEYTDNVVYITCRVTDGVAAYSTCAKYGWYCAGEDRSKPWGTYQLGYAVAKPANGSTFQDFVDYKIELPHGTKSITICSFGDDLQVACKKRKLETTTTVTETTRPLASGTSTTNKKLVLATHTEEETNERTGEVTTKIVVDDPPHAVTENDSNYNYRIVDVRDLPHGTKVYISARAEVGTILYAASAYASLSNIQTSYMPADSTNNRFKEINAYEYTIEAGVNYIHVVSYEGPNSTGADWPKVTYNRKETTTKNNYIPEEKYVTIEEANNVDITDTVSGITYRWHEKGSPYVINKPLVEKYGWIERMLSFENIADPNLLCTSAVEYVKNSAFDEMSIDLSAIDMRALGAINVEYFNVEDQVHATSIMHGLDKVFPITKLSIPLNKPDGMKVTIGETQSDTMTDGNNRVNQEILNNISYTTKNVLTEAKDHAAALIGTGGNGYVSLIKDETNDYIKEIVISDQPDPHNSSDVWIFNRNGLGHFHSNSGHAYPLPTGVDTNLALTMDGQIVAERIAAGIIEGLGLTSGAAIFKNGNGIDRTGVVFADVSGGVGSETGYVKAMEMKSGCVNFWNCTDVTISKNLNNTINYTISQQGLPDTAYNRGRFAWISAVKEQTGTNKPVLSMSSPILAIAADEVWIDSSRDATDAVSGLDDGVRYYVINSNAALLGSTSSGIAGPYYLPTTNDPQSSSDYETVYVRDGVIVTSSSLSPDPTKGIIFRKGFAV